MKRDLTEEILLYKTPPDLTQMALCAHSARREEILFSR